jgi:indole-3-glycerol phosphate synthase
MDKLQRIIDHKRAELAMLRCARPEATLRQLLADQPATAKHRSLRAALQHPKPGIIAEFKRRSPSAGAIATGIADPVQVCRGYELSGASALSVLTDEYFFGGSLDDLRLVRAAVDLPILRKDFLLESYQLLEAKLAGADAVLLIAECLEADELAQLHGEALELGLEVLIEMHGPEQVRKLPASAQLVGINHRDLRDFSVDLRRGPERLPALREACPEALAIAESGVNSAADASMLIRAGFDALLIGSLFMSSEDPVAGCSELVSVLRTVNTTISKPQP